MSKVTISIDSEDVPALREILHLALIQSEAVLDDAEATYAYPDDVYPAAIAAHNVTCQLLALIDAMLPDSTGFFDCPLSGWAEDVLEDD